MTKWTLAYQKRDFCTESREEVKLHQPSKNVCIFTISMANFLHISQHISRLDVYIF